MGFLSLFKGRKKEEPKTPELPPADMKLSELSAWLGQELSEKTSSARKRSGDLQEKIARGFGQLVDSAKRLRGAEFEVRDKTYAAVNSVKNTFANRTQSLAGKCPTPALDSYSDMREFQKRAGDLLRGLMDITPRQGMIISSYFKKEGSSVMNGIKNLNSALEEFQRFLDYEGKSLFILEEAARIFREISDSLNSVRNLEMRGKEIEEGIRELKEGLAKREKDLDAISRNPRWEGLEEAKRGKESLEGRARDLKFRIGEELSHAKRPMKKYLHLRAGELSREERLFLERFVKSPLKVIMGSGLEQLKPLLASLRDMVGGEISLKEKEIQKLDELMKRMGSGEIADSIREYETALGETVEKGKAIERDFSGLNEEKRQAESEMEESGKELKRFEGELEETRKNRENLRNDIENSRKKLEELIYENINRRVNIDLNK